MRLSLKTPLLAPVILLALTSGGGHADPVPGPSSADTLDLSEGGEPLVNGVPYRDASRTLYVNAQVVKVIQGPEGSTVLYLRPLAAHRAGAGGNLESLSVTGEPRPFVPEGDWKMFDAEGAETADPRFALRVTMPYPLSAADALFEANWNECDGPVSGNYSGMPCNVNRGLSDDYVVFLKRNYLPCVNEGMRSVGLARAIAVHLQHDGTTADQHHHRGSLHGVGRAIDVMQITTQAADGRQTLFDFQKTNVDHRVSRGCKPAGTALCRFFEGFRACWHRVHVARRCPARHDGPIGTIGWEDADHIAHHLHTSYPFCPNSKGYYITKAREPATRSTRR